jgi:hypothetical protein
MNHKPNVQRSDRPFWRCYCPPPNHLRTGPGLCPHCVRFPYVCDDKGGKRLPGTPDQFS